MNKEEILEQFKQQNPKLLELNPTILVTTITESWSSETDETIVYDPPKVQIEVRHPFIFDLRLIPKEFNGNEVIETIVGGYPSEFPSVNAALPLEDWYAPERYIKFVDKNLDLIRKKIKTPNLTRDEALDALTGDFKNHINKYVKMRISNIDEEIENIAFFYKLLYETRQKYYLSDVYQKHKDKHWYYSITATRFSKNRPLIVGFNWGAEKGYKYQPQCEYPFADFEGIYDDLGSLKRTIPLFHEYHTKAIYGMQTNLCFFRSEKEEQISYNDLKLCKPLFEKYLDYVEPSIIISFSSKLRNYFIDNNLIFNKKSLSIDFAKGKLEVIKANYKMKNGRIINFVYLPHPNAHISNENRLKAWEFCFNNMN
jgi:hypothetical protein